MPRFTVQYSLLEIREVQVEATSEAAAMALVESQEALYSTNPLWQSDVWVISEFNKAHCVTKSEAYS